jgi:adenylate cyclase
MTTPNSAPAESGAAVHHRIRRLTVLATVTAHLVGAAVVVVLLVFVLPVPPALEGSAAVIRRNLIAAIAYVGVIVPAGVALGLGQSGRATRWLVEERAPTECERELTLGLGLRLLAMQTGLWAGAVVLFYLLNASTSRILALEIAITVALGGVTTAAIAYLLAERIGRAMVARALAGVPPHDYAVPGVATRALFSWALGTAVPVFGIVVIAAVSLGLPIPARRLAGTALFLAVTALVVGLGVMIVFAQSIADPLRTLRRALGEVEAGRLEPQVAVDDASEVGFLQAAFNRMVWGLRERERLRDLFGRHVGQDVARRALEEGVTLGGEERDAAVLFVDLIGSTTFAAEHGPGEVLATLNAFFAIVVESTGRQGGFVNKFEGDAALCIFGVPLELEDAPGAALGAGREMQTRLTHELPQIRAGVGLSAGTVIAGNVGAADRFEYTVIGDPVNEAARLAELAKDRPGRVVASEAIVAHAGAGEAACWEPADTVVLRGRTRPTRLAVPARRAAKGTG